MEKKVPILCSKIVQLVLKGKRNEEIIFELGLEGEKNSLNASINLPRKWFEAHDREKKYAIDLINAFPADQVQSRFEHFCSMSKPMQLLAKDNLLEERQNKLKRMRPAMRKEFVSA